jgi:chemotaxis protein CheD
MSLFYINLTKRLLMPVIEKLFLYPGHLVVTKGAMEISTILGSCVSVCLFDRGRHIAGINHFLLPFNDNPDSDIEKYGDTSLNFMLGKILKMGSNQADLVAKVFGGGEVLTYENSNFNIGKHNIEVALEFIHHHKIKLISREVGGTTGAKIIFNTHTGIVTHKYLSSSVLPSEH